MKFLSLYIIILLVSITSVAYAIQLPSHPFFGANELYEDNSDKIEYSVGAKISGINISLETTNNSWGEECLKEGEQGACQDCCTASLKNVEVNKENLILFNTCIKACGGGESLTPLGSTLWLLPFAFAYGFYRRYKSKKVDR